MSPMRVPENSGAQTKLKLVPRLNKQQIYSAVKSLADAIVRDYEGLEPTFAIVMDGAMAFAHDLCQRAADKAREQDRQAKSGPLAFAFKTLTVWARSYDGEQRTPPQVWLSPDADDLVPGRDIIVIDDNVATGWTMYNVVHELACRKPRSIRAASLIVKPATLQVPVRVDYGGFDAPDCSLVGYWMDFHERFRDLPDIREVVLEGESSISLPPITPRPLTTRRFPPIVGEMPVDLNDLRAESPRVGPTR